MKRSTTQQHFDSEPNKSLALYNPPPPDIPIWVVS